MKNFATTLLALLALAIMTASQPALAKEARCFTSEEGRYPCDFKFTDKAGSFETSAPGKPTMILIIDAPGVALGFADFGTGRNVSLPGQFIQVDSDKACWLNTETADKICAW